MNSKGTFLILSLIFIYFVGATPLEASHKDNQLEIRGNHTRHVTYCIKREKGGMEAGPGDYNWIMPSESIGHVGNEDRIRRPFAVLFIYDGRFHIPFFQGKTGKVHNGKCFRIRAESEKIQSLSLRAISGSSK